MRNSIRLCLGVLTLAVAGCTFLQPTQLPAINKYSLTQSSQARLSLSPSAKTVLVATVSANPAYQTAKMVYLIKPHQISTFTKNKWVGSPADMLQPLLVQSLRNSGYFHAVVAAPFSGKMTYRLDAHVIELAQNFMTKPSSMTFSLQVEIVSNKTDRVIASKTFTAKVAALGNNPQSGVTAANKAVREVLTQVTRFTVQSVVGKKLTTQQRSQVELDKPFS